LDVVKIFIPENNKWQIGPALPQPLGRASCHEFQNDLLIVGGQNSVGESRKIFRFELKSRKWTEIGSQIIPPGMSGAVSIMMSKTFCAKQL
jgi:hypothetical protein